MHTIFAQIAHFVVTTAIILGNKGKYCWLSNTYTTCIWWYYSTCNASTRISHPLVAGVANLFK